VDLLLIEDDDAIAASLHEPLTRAGFVVNRVDRGAAALEQLRDAPVDVVLLDLGLPDMDGYDVCRQIRATSNVPVIVVTARSDEFDRVLGLELGADDYMVKPLGARELIARIRAVLRRTGSPSTPADGRTTGSPATGGSATDDGTAITVGPLTIDHRTHRATLDGESLALTPKEFDLLGYLAEDPGAVRTRTDIIERVWDANWFGPTKTLDAHVAGIRRKLGDRQWIEAVRGVGFRLVAPSEWPA
jgi:two-component system response regulator RegX3